MRKVGRQELTILIMFHSLQVFVLLLAKEEHSRDTRTLYLVNEFCKTIELEIRKL